VPALVFGVAFGNLFEGVPFGFDSDLRMHSTITLVLAAQSVRASVGIVSLSMIVLHGAVWLNLKTDGAVKARAHAVIPYAALAFAILFALAGFWLSHLQGFQIVGPDGA
jgi:cytochrome d ubiquinol oxidase subunit II